MAEAEKQFPAKRTFNLRRKCNWTPRHEPVLKSVFYTNGFDTGVNCFQLGVSCQHYLTVMFNLV